jgi:hypothetical protein
VAVEDRNAAVADPRRTTSLNRLQGGRIHLGTLAGIKSERWPTSARNRWPACVGICSLKEKLIKIGAKVVSHSRYVAFQMAEVAVPRMLFAEILRLIADLRPPPDPTPA